MRQRDSRDDSGNRGRRAHAGFARLVLGPPRALREAARSIARVGARFTADGPKDRPGHSAPLLSLLRVHKPYGVLCQFTDPEGRPTLRDYVDVPNVYAAGRLDRDSEGLLLLTNSGALQHWLAHPRSGVEKSYWVLLDQTPSADALKRLRDGVVLRDGPARALRAERCPPPPLPERNPPPRIKSSSAPCWLSVTLDEGRNRLLRRLCAAIGAPVLRLIRYRIGPFELDDLTPGAWALAPLPPGFTPPSTSRPGPGGRRPPPRSKPPRRPGPRASKTPPQT